MKLVTFGRAMAPHGVGDTRLVPDEVAKRLEAEGALSGVKPWPTPVLPARPVLKLKRPSGTAAARIAR